MGQPTLALFASRLYHKLPRYIAWKPAPGSIAADAFLHPWDRKYGFAFPAFSFISQVLRKILKEKIDHLIIVIPTWQSQPWYALVSWYVYTAAISSVSSKKFVNRSSGQKSSSSRNRVSEISGVEGFLEILRMKGISSNAAKLISHSRRKSSTTNYESAWGQ